MGAEQSALLVCTQTGKPETPLKLNNAEQFFQLYFDKMSEPRTGPVTEALLHLIKNVNSPNLELEPRGDGNWPTKPSEIDSGYENDDPEVEEVEEASDDAQEEEIDMVSEEETFNELSDSDISIESTSSNFNQPNDEDSDFELIPIEFVDLQPIDLLDLEDPKLEFEKEFVIRVAEINNEDI